MNGWEKLSQDRTKQKQVGKPGEDVDDYGVAGASNDEDDDVQNGQNEVSRRCDGLKLHPVAVDIQ